MPVMPIVSRAALSLTCLLLLASGASSQDPEALFQEGVDAYRTGDLRAAVEAFQAVLAANPGHEQAFRLWQHVEHQVMLQMLMERGEMGALAERFLGLARLGRREVITAPGSADELVDTILSGDELERQRALLELQASFGSWAVPALVRPLGDAASTDNRVLAIQALIRLGDAAVLPLIAVLDASDVTTRRNAAAVLGTLKDRRAGPALAWMARGDEDPVARSVAADALAKLELGDANAEQLSAQLAAAFFGGDDRVLKPYASATVLWSWEDGRLSGRAVLGGLHGLEMAEQYALDALENGAGGSVRALLAAVHAAQKAEIRAAAELDALVDHEQLQAAVEGLPDLDVNLALAGNHRGFALDLCRSPRSRREPAALALMEVMGSGPDELRALRTALKDDSVAVSLGAAMALARQGVAGPQVVARLGHALTTVPDRMVVSIGDGGLSGSAPGWKLLAARDVSAGLLRAKAFPPKDVVVLREGFGGVTLDAMVYGLRNDPRTEQVPIIVVSDDPGRVQGLYGDVVAKVVAAARWADVNEVAGARVQAVQRALNRARSAAEALAGLAPEVVRALSPQIGAALGAAADDGLKLAALNLVDRAGLVDALPAVERLLADENQAIEVRVGCMHAAARLWALNGGRAAGGDLSGALLAAVRSGDGPLAAAAAAALGQLGDVSEAAIRDVVR